MPSTLQTLPRKLFHAMSLRERVLLTVFLWFSVLAWLVSAVNAFGTAKRNWAEAGARLESQNEWFDNREEIEAQLNSALQKLDPKKTYTGAQLVGLLDTIARETGVNFDINAPVTKYGNIFNVHTVRVILSKAGIAELIGFDRRIKEHSPYLGLERVQVDANKTDPRLLNSQFIVSSFELGDKNL